MQGGEQAKNQTVEQETIHLSHKKSRYDHKRSLMVLEPVEQRRKYHRKEGTDRIKESAIATVENQRKRNAPEKEKLL